jgi:ribosome-associated protein
VTIQGEALTRLVVEALEDLKGDKIEVIDVREVTAITDTMVIVSGTSSRHVRSLATNLIKVVKEAGLKPQGIEGDDGSDWVLVDLGEIVVHVMRPDVRDFYGLEKLWRLEESGGSGEERQRVAGGRRPPSLGE